MIEKKRLEKILLEAISEDKAVIGAKNVLKYMKGSKFIIFSSSIDLLTLSRVFRLNTDSSE